MCPTCVKPLEQTSPSSGSEPLLVLSERKSVKCPCPLDLLYRPRGDNNRELQLYKICQIMRLWRLGFARKEVCLVSLSQACCARHKWIMIGNAVVQSTQAMLSNIVTKASGIHEKGSLLGVLVSPTSLDDQQQIMIGKCSRTMPRMLPEPLYRDNPSKAAVGSLLV